MASEAEIERMVVRIIGDSKSFQRMVHQSVRSSQRAAAQVQRQANKIEGFGKSMNRFATGVAKNFRRMAGIASGALAAVGAAGAFSIFKINASLDELAKRAKTLGVTVEALSRLRFAGERSGLAVAAVDMSLQRLRRRAAEAAQGTGEAVKAFNQLGINAQEFIRLNVEEQMATLARAFSQFDNSSTRLALAFKLFDSEGAKMINVIGDGEAAFRRLLAQADKFGATVSSRAAKGAEMVADEMTNLSSTIGAVARELKQDLDPLLLGLAANLKNVRVETKKLQSAQAAERGAGISGFIARQLEGFGDLIRSGRQQAFEDVGTFGRIFERFGFGTFGGALQDEAKQRARRARAAVGITEDLEKSVRRAQAKINEAANAAGGAGKTQASGAAGAGPGAGTAAGKPSPLQQRIDELTKSLKLQAKTFGLNAREAEIMKLRMEGAKSAQLAEARAANRVIEQLRRQAKAREEATKAAEKQARAVREIQAKRLEVINQFLTPQEQFAKRIIELRRMEGILPKRTFGRAVQAAIADFERAQAGVAPQLREATLFQREAAAAGGTQARRRLVEFQSQLRPEEERADRKKNVENLAKIAERMRRLVELEETQQGEPPIQLANAGLQ